MSITACFSLCRTEEALGDDFACNFMYIFAPALLRVGGCPAAPRAPRAVLAGWFALTLGEVLSYQLEYRQKVGDIHCTGCSYEVAVLLLLTVVGAC